MSKSAVWSVITVFLAGILGSILTFVAPKTVIAIGLGFGRHDDRVLVGILLLIIAEVSVYKLLTLVMGSPQKSVPAKKRKK
jgi:hypothetical protein